MVCRQLGCDPVGARRVNPVPYVTDTCTKIILKRGFAHIILLLADIIIATHTCRYGYSSEINTNSPFAFACNGDETDLEACPRLGRNPPCYAGEVASAIAIVCGGVVSDLFS